jgi:SulP family sulfate permease
MMKKGLDQFIPFVVTVVAVVFTDLLTGVGIGILVATFYILRANMHNAYHLNIKTTDQSESETAVFTLAEEVTFLNKAPIQQKLYNLPKSVKSIIIDGQKSKFIDKDVIDVIKDFEQNALSKGLEIELNDVTYKRKSVRKKQKLKKVV